MNEWLHRANLAMKYLVSTHHFIVLSGYAYISVVPGKWAPTFELVCSRGIVDVV